MLNLYKANDEKVDLLESKDISITRYIDEDDNQQTVYKYKDGTMIIDIIQKYDNINFVKDLNPAFYYCLLNDLKFKEVFVNKYPHITYGVVVGQCFIYRVNRTFDKISLLSLLSPYSQENVSVVLSFRVSGKWK